RRSIWEWGGLSFPPMRTNRGYRHVDDDGSVAEPPPPPLSTSRPPPLAASSSYRAVAVEEDERGGTMSIKVLDVQGHTYSLTVASDATVAALKDQLVEVSQVERERQRIIHMGKVLQDGDTLASHKVQCGTTLHLFQRPKGVLPLPPPPLDPADPAAAARGSISAVAGIPGGVPHLTVHGGDYGSAGLFGDAAWQLDNARRGLRFLASFLFLVQTMQALEALAIITGPNDHTDRAVSFLIYAILLRSVMGMAVGALGVRASHGTEPAVLRLYFWGLVLTGIVAILIRADVLFDFVSGELPLPPVPPGSSSSSDDRGGGGGGGGRSSGSSSGRRLGLFGLRVHVRGGRRVALLLFPGEGVCAGDRAFNGRRGSILLTDTLPNSNGRRGCGCSTETRSASGSGVNKELEVHVSPLPRSIEYEAS
ncbi:unnamed protein product, partial [Phaeothamnion confervicola]